MQKHIHSMNLVLHDRPQPSSKIRTRRRIAMRRTRLYCAKQKFEFNFGTDDAKPEDEEEPPPPSSPKGASRLISEADPEVRQSAICATAAEIAGLAAICTANQLQQLRR